MPNEYSPKKCPACAVEFEPTSGRQIRCAACRLSPAAAARQGYERLRQDPERAQRRREMNTAAAKRRREASGQGGEA